MLKKWKRLDELTCVKRFGIRHKISHFLGIHYISTCFTAIGDGFNQRIIKGLKEDGSKEA